MRPYQEAAVAAARRHRAAHGSAILEEFSDFLALPNVSSDLTDVRRVADHIVSMLERRRVTARLLEHPEAAPIVTGTITGAGERQTIGIYAHYDGQPVDPTVWTTPPFVPTLLDHGEQIPIPPAGDPIDEEWRMRARSAADDKTPILALVTALDALHAAGMEPAVDLVLLFEGEEEIGSPHLASSLRQHRGLFAADLWLICDGPVHQSGRPQIIFGVRGIAEMEITVYGPARGLHSGHYGNWAPNPASRLATLLASMKDDSGRVLVDGFFDDVVAPTPAELEAIGAIPPYEEDLLDELAIGAPEGSGESLIERMYLPSLNVRGLSAGGVGDLAANVVPDSATASIDVRLPAGHDGDAMLDHIEAHIRAQGFHVVSEPASHAVRRAHNKVALVKRRSSYPGLRLPVDHPAGTAVLAAAAAAGASDVVAMPTLGGSVPIAHFAEHLGSPTVIAPMANHDNNQHDADENLRIGNLWYGIDLMAALLTMDTEALR